MRSIRQRACRLLLASAVGWGLLVGHAAAAPDPIEFGLTVERGDTLELACRRGEQAWSIVMPAPKPGRAG